MLDGGEVAGGEELADGGVEGGEVDVVGSDAFDGFGDCVVGGGYNGEVVVGEHLHGVDVGGADGEDYFAAHQVVDDFGGEGHAGANDCGGIAAFGED